MTLFVNTTGKCVTKKRRREKKHIMVQRELAATCSTFILKEKNIGNILIDQMTIQFH